MHLDYLDILQKSPFDAIKEQLLTLWGGELQPDNFTVHLQKKIGADRLFPIRHRRNIGEMICTEDIEPVITRLHVRGYESANFEEINEGKDYLDSDYSGKYSHILERYVDFPDIDDPEELFSLGLEELHRVEMPAITWEIRLIDMRRKDGYIHYQGLEEFDLGDTALLHHPDYAGDLVLRCNELEHDALQGVNTRVVLGNAKENFLGSMSSLRKITETLHKVATHQGFLKADRVVGDLVMENVGNLTSEILRLAGELLDISTIRWSQIINMPGEAISLSMLHREVPLFREYAHSRLSTGVHVFTGVGQLGRTQLQADILPGDRFMVNGQHMGAVARGYPGSFYAGAVILFLMDSPAEVIRFL